MPTILKKKREMSLGYGEPCLPSFAALEGTAFEEITRLGENFLIHIIDFSTNYIRPCVCVYMCKVGRLH